MFFTVQESFTTDVEATAFNALVQSSKVKIIKVGENTPDIVGEHHSTSRTLLFYLISKLVGDNWYMIAENGMAIHVTKGRNDDLFYITSQCPNKKFEWSGYVDDEDYIDTNVYDAILTLWDVISGVTLTNLTPLHWLDLGSMYLANAPKLEYGIESEVSYTHEHIRVPNTYYTYTFNVLSRNETTVTVEINDWVYTCNIINFSDETLEYEKENYFEYKPDGNVAYLNGAYIQFYDTGLNKFVRGTDPVHKNVLKILHGI